MTTDMSKQFVVTPLNIGIPFNASGVTMLPSTLHAIAGVCLSMLLLETGNAAETVAPLMQQALPNLPGKTFTAAIVEFPPGVAAEPHRHGDAFVYAYVLSGSVRSQLDEEPVRVFRAGENWSEAPGAHHRLTENVSRTEPARLLVVFISTPGAPLKTVDKP